MLLLVPQVGEVDKGNKGSGNDDHPWLEAACHKLFVANISGLPGGEDKFLDLRRCEDCNFATFTKKFTFPVC